ncbi:oligosaccharide flippase family protein [Flavobacterium sp. MFBS3-15]|uniref:lipopolysaccharide biosynthesis protein n=1 Tax=Flavobacterium sp. MFBS3-15 TaxID=2989816 RepID=UPI002235C485|nr:oligosaccharide flippase family protein [Flavobacterium sp. MFBS3-15]MCW4470688.1 oligosaccharide flippase family protein [Flavobacterium sp. MFBS3-15]
MEKQQAAPMKQVVWFAIINYLGTGIGVVSSLLIYPKNYEFQGTVRYIDSISQLLFPIMVLGASQSLIKFYPALTEQRQKQLFSYSVFSVFAVSVLVFAGILLYENFGSPEFKGLVYFAFPIAVALAFVELFKKQLQDLQKIAVPAMFEKIIPKIVLPAAFLLLLYKGISRNEALWLYMSGFLLILVLTSVYLFKKYRPGFNYRFKTLFGEISRKEYFRYSLYSLAGSLGSLLAFRIDGLIIPNMISLEANGVFSNGAMLATTLQIPAVGMFALYAPIISNYLRSHNMGDLNVKYKEIARLLFFIGAVLYGCIIIGLDDLFRLMPDYTKLQPTIPIIEILGFSVLINMATGFNGEIITYSKYYRFNLVAVLLLIVLNVSLNIWFIGGGYGIVGVAWASFISMTLFNISKLIFIYKKFGLLPFDKKFLQMGIVFAVTGIAVYFLPSHASHLVTLTYKTLLYMAGTIIIIYKFRMVYQVNATIDKVLAKIKR